MDCLTETDQNPDSDASFSCRILLTGLNSLCPVFSFNVFEFAAPSEFRDPGLPCGSAGKESACNVGDLSSITGMGRSSGERKTPLQYSGLENSMDCIVHCVAKSWTRLSDFYFHFSARILAASQCWLDGWDFQGSASCSGCSHLGKCLSHQVTLGINI